MNTQYFKSAKYGGTTTSEHIQQMYDLKIKNNEISCSEEGWRKHEDYMNEELIGLERVQGEFSINWPENGVNLKIKDIVKTKTTKKLYIIPENKEKIEGIFNSLSTKATMRRASIGNIFHAVRIANEKIGMLPAKLRKGFYMQYSMNSKKPGAYKYKYEADVFTIEYCSKTKLWILVLADRREFWPSQSDQTFISYKKSKDDQKNIEKEAQIKEILFNKFFEC